MKPYNIVELILFSPFQLLYFRFFRSLSRLAVLVTHTMPAFTLIELLVVITVVGVLTGGVIALINPPKQLANARNAQRKNDLRTIANALEAYAIDHGGFPVTYTTGVRWCNTSYASGTSYLCADKPLDVLVSVYLKKLPVDPYLNKIPNEFNASCAKIYGYIYRSDTGKDYKILDYSSPEVNQVSATDPMKDPPRSGTSWSIYTPGGSGY